MEAGQIFSIFISTLALATSITTLWLTLLRKGRVMMTKPTVIYFGPDGGDDKNISKVFFRAMLYSTAKRGHFVEQAYVRLRRGETQQNFNIWVYGEDKLARGSGLFVGNEGISTNHHFLTPADVKGFEFTSGDYTLEFFVSVVGEPTPISLAKTKLTISSAEAEQLGSNENGIYFDWGPDSGQYLSHIDGSMNGKKADTISLLRALSESMPKNELKDERS